MIKLMKIDDSSNEQVHGCKGQMLGHRCRYNYYNAYHSSKYVEFCNCQIKGSTCACILCTWPRAFLTEPTGYCANTEKCGGFEGTEHLRTC